MVSYTPKDQEQYALIFGCYSILFTLFAIKDTLASLTSYSFASVGQAAKDDLVCSMISLIRAFGILASLPSLMRYSSPEFLPSPITMVLCSPPGPEENVRS